MRPIGTASSAVAACALLFALDSTAAGGAEPPALDGKALYAAHCLACHQADGQGVPFMQPPLVDGAWVKADAQALALFVLSGGFKSAQRKETHGNVMPSFVALDDATVAAILTYVRDAFGGKAGPVSVAEVAAARGRLPP